MRPFRSTIGPITHSRTIEQWKAILQLDPDDDEAEQKARMDVEARAEDNITRALGKQRRELLPRGASDDVVAAAASRVDETSGPVRDALRAALVESADLGVAVAVEQFDSIGFAFDWTLANEAARDWADRHAGELISGVNATTKRNVQRSVAAWVDNGEPLSALVSELETTFGRKRAQLIASTEVTQAYAEANRLSYLESGVVDTVEWRTANDERVCPICGPLHGKTDDAERPDFDGVGIPPAHPRCRCWIVPVVPDG